MNVFSIFSKICIFFILAFGIIDTLPSGLKEIPQLMLVVFSSLVFVIYLFTVERKMYVDGLVLFLVFIYGISFMNFVICFFHPPVIVAADCEGHQVMSLQGIQGVLWSPVLTLVLGTGFLYRKVSKTLTERILVGICLLILLLAAFKINFIVELQQDIDRVSTPIQVLPEGC